MSIHPILEKIKSIAEKEWFTSLLMVFVILLVGLAGFGLGRLSTINENKGVIIENVNNDVSDSPIYGSKPKNLAGGSNTNIVASKNGTKYYFSWCSGVGRIQDNNKAYFISEQEAVDAGYTKASGCE